MIDGNPAEKNPGVSVQGVNFTRVEALFGRLANAISQGREAPAAPGLSEAALRAEYQTAVDMVKLLCDIRFKCLTFVTAVIAVANLLLGNSSPVTRIMLGLVGFLTTLGIAVYEMRNSQLYEAAMHRAKVLEKELHAVRSSKESLRGGLFSERPPYVESTYWKNLTHEERAEARDNQTAELMRFWRVEIKHDQGLALIYGAVLGGWAYMIADSLLSMPPPFDLWPPAPWGVHRAFSALIAFWAFAFSYRRFVYHDGHRFKPGAPA
jgi:hypothetical protein